MDEPNNHHAEDGEEEMRMDIDNDNVQIDNQLQLNALPHFEFEQMNLEEQPDLLLNPAEMPMSLDVDEPNNDIDGNYPHNPAANPLAEPAVIPNVLPAPRPMRCKTKKVCTSRTYYVHKILQTKTVTVFKSNNVIYFQSTWPPSVGNGTRMLLYAEYAEIFLFLDAWIVTCIPEIMQIAPKHKELAM